MLRARLMIPVATALLLAACGSDSSTTSSSPATTTDRYGTTATTAAPTTTAAPLTVDGPAALQVADGALGPILVDGEGMTVYLFTKDTQGAPTSVCSGDCLVAWPPVVTTGSPVAGTGLDASKLGVITRDDGSTQATYAGWPLYFFAKDAAAGDTAGQGVGGVWFAVKADGSAAG